METLLQDLRFAGRTLLKRPAFTFIAVLTLALGIGANTAIFSVVNSVLLAELPFADPERLTMVWASNPELAAKVGLPDMLPVSPGDFYDWKKAGAFEKLAMMRTDRLSLTGEGEPEQLNLVAVTGEFFQALGTPPLAGRAIQPGDDGSKATVVVLSHAFWQRRFGGDRGVIGRTVRLDGNPMMVAGVMPPDFVFPRGAQMPAGFGFAAEPDGWYPMAMTPEERQHRGNHSQLAIGLLKPGRGIGAAQAEMDAISDRLEQTYPESQGWRSRVEPLREQLVGNVRPALLILLGAVGVVLLVACVNVANLLLAQAAARQKEIAVRTALGAGRGRMVRQLLTESALLALVGGAFGLLLASWGLRALVVWIPDNVPVSSEIPLDGRVLAFALAATFLAGALAGLVPAFQMTRPDLAETLRDGTRAGSGTARGARTRSALVVLETALAVLLVVGAGLLVRSFASLLAVDPGFRPEGVLTMNVALPGTKYPDVAQRAAFAEAVIERLRALPGVTAAGMVSNLPMSGEESIDAVVIEGAPPPKPGEVPLADYRSATPGYFEAMGIRLLQGRLFNPGDGAQAPRVAVIDATMARAYWPGTDPLGKRFRRGLYGDKEKAPWLTVIGVVDNVRHSGLHVEPRPQMYFAQAQSPAGGMYFAVRTGRDPESLIADARAAVFAVDRDQPVTKILTMEQVVFESLAGRRFNMVLLGIFAGLALVLAAVGIYGITSYSVVQRTREMGLRMALGAQPWTVLALVLREAGKLTALGLAAGLALALAATRLMASLLFGVGSADPATFAAVAVGLAAVALLAAYLPGRRATQVDPMVALRAD
jgi:putative ABC transport system permease protein